MMIIILSTIGLSSASNRPAVAEVAVLGVPDPKWGEVGVAVVVRREGEQGDGNALLAHLEGRCARYRWPHHVF